MTLIINNLQNKVSLSPEFLSLLEEINQRVLREEGVSPEGEVSLCFVDNEYMKELNSKYRNRNEPTDVLSFPQQEPEEVASPPEKVEILWGDIIISLDRAVEQAEEEGHSLKKEVAFLFVHGLLHLLGYDHESPADYEKMWAKKRMFLEDIDFDQY